MHVLLLQNNPCMNDLSQALLKKYPTSSIIQTSGSSFPETRPILNEKWLIRLSLRRSFVKQIAAAAKIKDKANFIFIAQNQIDAVRKALNEHDIEYQLVDNLRPDKDKLTQHVQTTLGITDNLAEHIVARSNRHEPVVLKNVQLLSLITEKRLTEKAVDKYLQDNAGVSFSYLYRFILLHEGSYKKVIKLIYRYQNAPGTICRYIVDKLTQDIELFLEILDGNLSRENSFDYAEQHKLSNKSVQDAIFLFNRVTLETLYAKLLLFESLLGTDCIQLIMKGCK